MRVSAGGTLALQGGMVASERWVEVREGGILIGAGDIATSLYNDGIVAPEKGSLNVASGYRGSGDSVLKIALSGKGASRLKVKGNARLAGELKVAADSNTAVDSGKAITVLEADSISGSFANPGGKVRSNTGQRFQIGYTETLVTLTPIR